MFQRTGFAFKRAGGLACLAGSLILVGAVLTPQPAAAAGNPHFEAILSAEPPTGFMSSPTAYDISGGPVTVNFVVVASNLTDQAHTVALHFSADHILTDNGANVADGQPGQPGIAFSGPQGTTQAVIAGTQSFTRTWDANGTETLALAYTFDSCGYFQLDVWAPWKGGEGSRNRATLASGFVRILGCDAASTPTPTPTVTGGGNATPTPSPEGAVQGITATPSTGAGSGWLPLAAGLLIGGAGLLVAGARRRRTTV
jgi:LPXTG-motif cell wall-anchored protein